MQRTPLSRALVRPITSLGTLALVVALATSGCQPGMSSDASWSPRPAASARPAATGLRHATLQVAEAPRPAPKASIRWKAGDLVSAVWPTDGHWYNAVIVGIAASGLFHVRYDDGIERSDITEKQIRKRGTASGGGGGGGGGGGQASCPGPGLTRRCGGTCVNLQTDDNNCGACGARCTGGKHCDGHMSCRDAAGNL
jgi:Lamin-B receptor of TUDOR domain